MRAWQACAAAGLATLVISFSFGRIAGLAPCGPTGGAGAIIAFELVRNAQDLAALFGSEPCTSRLIAAQREALWLDMLGFIPAYTLFLLGAVVALRRVSLGLALVAFNCFMFAGALDEIEGLIMFKLLADLAGTERLFDGLFWTVRPKFAFLGLGEILIGLMLWRGTVVAKLAAGALLAGGMVSLWFLFTDPHNPVMMRGHSIAWTALLVAALGGAVRPALVLPDREAP